MSDELDVQSCDGGVLLRVRVIPRARSTQVDGIREGSLRIRLNAPPVDGAANRALRDFIADKLGCRKRDVEIARGERSRDKTVVITGVDPATVRRAFSD